MWVTSQASVNVIGLCKYLFNGLIASLEGSQTTCSFSGEARNSF